jgi:hypothetical protein
VHRSANDNFDLKTTKYALDTDSTFSASADLSTIRTAITISDIWINHFMKVQQIVVPLSKKHHLSNIRFQWMAGRMKMEGEIMEKPGSWIDLQCVPLWSVDQQVFEIREASLQVRSRNILVKGAGWFSRTFMQARIDRKIELAVNQLYAQSISKFYAQPHSVVVLHGGRLTGNITSIRIHSMAWMEGNLKLDVTVEGRLNLMFA